MKHIKTFEKYQNKKRRDDIIRESVLQVNDIYKVRAMIDVPQSLINSYVKKVKDMTGKNIRQFFGDVDIAEEIVKFINLEFLNVDKLPGGFLTGDAQAQPQAQVQTGEESIEPQAQTQPQAQVQNGEESIEDQSQDQPEGQVQVQTEVQDNASDDGFEDVQTQSQDEDESEDESEELPEDNEETEI